MIWFFKISMAINFVVLNQDILSLAENALSNPSPSISKIKEEIAKNVKEESGILGKWYDAKLDLTMTFKPDGTFVSVGKGQTLDGTWKLNGTSFSAILPDKKGYVSYMKGTFQSGDITYTYYVTHPEKGRSGQSDSHILKKQSNGI